MRTGAPGGNGGHTSSWLLLGKHASLSGQFSRASASASKAPAVALGFKGFPADCDPSVLCFLGLCCIGSDEVLGLRLLVPGCPGLLVETALASATQDQQDPHQEQDNSKHQPPNPQALIVIMEGVLLLLSGTDQDGRS